METEENLAAAKSKRTAQAILELTEALKDEFGDDFHLRVLGNGKVLGQAPTAGMFAARQNDTEKFWDNFLGALEDHPPLGNVQRSRVGQNSR